MHLTGFIVVLSALVAADAAEKGDESRLRRRARALQKADIPIMSMSMSAEGIEMRTFEVPTGGIDNASNDKESKGRKLARDNVGNRRALQQAYISMSMSMSLSVVPGTSIEGIEMPMLALGKEENIKVSTFTIGTTGLKGAETKSEEDIGAASSKKREKMPKEEKKAKPEKKAKSEKIAKSEKKRDRRV